MVDHHRSSLVRLSVALLTAAALVFTGLPAAAQDTVEPDILDELEAIAGLTVVEELPVATPGFRYFVLSYTQYVDHERPRAGTFEQRLTLLHRGFDRPTVLQTSGYNVRTVPSRSEPTRLLDGNQISTEQRFFLPSRPDPADWDTLTIRQAAADHHRVIEAINDVYTGAWISTGASKGGMTSVYHRRFYPDDLDGTVAYVAPNDVIDREDSAYLEFFDTVGDDPACQESLEDVQRTALERRPEIVAYYEDLAQSEDLTFDNIGSADAALEMLVLDSAWMFWQYIGTSGCDGVPAQDAPTDEIVAFLDNVAGFAFYADQGIEPYVPYYYQAATQLGTPSVPTGHVDDLLEYPGLYRAANYLPPGTELPRYDHRAMIDIDRWVRTRGSELLFVNGEYDPWTAEPFRVGPRGERRDAHVFTAPGANHGASIAALTPEDQGEATATLLRWAGLADEVTLRSVPEYVPGLDDVDDERRPL